MWLRKAYSQGLVAPFSHRHVLQADSSLARPLVSCHTTIPTTPPTRPPGSLMAAEQAARERERLKFLEELHAARTLGVEREAAILLEHGRVVLPQEAVPDRSGGGVRDSTTANGGGSGGGAQGRWVSHVCRELRRNRFAAQRGAMRRNVMPAALPPRLATAVGGEGAGARVGTSPFSPPPTTTGSVRSRASAMKTKSRKTLRSPVSAKSVRVSHSSRGRRKRRAE